MVHDHANAFLLGQRTNRPAEGYWFVPGGRILKNESIETAFKRLTRVELGVEIALSNAVFGCHLQ